MELRAPGEIKPLAAPLDERQLSSSGGTVATVAPVSSANFFLAFVIAAAAGTAVFFHAERNRIRHPSAWASFVFLLLIIGLPSYALHVRRVRRSRQLP